MDPRGKMYRLVLLGLCVGAAVLSSGAGVAQKTGHLTVHATRRAASDLEVTGMVAGLVQGTSGFVSYDELSALPQTTVKVIGDSNFPELSGAVEVTGIPVRALRSALGALQASDLVDALCTDKYRAHYPANYVAAHDPIFVLKIDGKTPSQWAAAKHAYDPGPYLITHAHFVPAFRVLAHQDEAQIPSNVIRLNFTTTAAAYGPITPPGTHTTDSPVIQGFVMAKQNCLRCHFSGSTGGTKSGVEWNVLGAVAATQGDFFAKYVRDPKSVNPQAKMEGSPQYDDATMAALVAYFQTFSQNGVKH